MIIMPCPKCGAEMTGTTVLHRDGLTFHETCPVARPWSSTPRFELYPQVTMPNPQTVTWGDVERLGMDFPQVRDAIMLVELGRWTREQALLMLVHVYVDAWQRSFAELVDRRNREIPGRIFVPNLTPPETK